jgi:HSP20 family protein
MNIRELVPWGRHKREEEEMYRNGGDATLALRSDLNRVFDSFWNRLDLPALGVWDEAFGRSVLPRVDIRDLDKEIEVVAELPGMDERDVSVGVADGSLTIRGEQRSEREEERRGYLLHERTSGRIERIVPLPPDLDIDSARARFKNGVLTITIAKTPEAQAATRQIPVRRG